MISLKWQVREFLPRVKAAFDFLTGDSLLSQACLWEGLARFPTHTDLIVTLSFCSTTDQFVTKILSSPTQTQNHLLGPLKPMPALTPAGPREAVSNLLPKSTSSGSLQLSYEQKSFFVYNSPANESCKTVSHANTRKKLYIWGRGRA